MDDGFSLCVLSSSWQMDGVLEYHVERERERERERVWSAKLHGARIEGGDWRLRVSYPSMQCILRAVRGVGRS